MKAPPVYLLPELLFKDRYLDRAMLPLFSVPLFKYTLLYY